jgi:hypothetical protein
MYLNRRVYMNIKRITSAFTAGFVVALAFPAFASAAPTTEVVLESDVTRQAENTPPTDDWVIYTRAATPGTATFRAGPGDPPLGDGSLELATLTGSDKVFAFNYDHVGTSLSEVDTISYSTYRTAGSLQQVAALNVQVDYNGPDVAGGFTTLVFEPVYNTDQGPVVSGEWQDWIADGSGIWWSTQPINGQCAGATADCDKTWAEIVANNPDAVVIGGVGINQGSGNPGLVTAVDAFTFDDVTYDFELVAPKPVKATTKDQCKNGGYKNFQTQYKNQGDCVSSVASNGRADNNPQF